MSSYKLGHLAKLKEQLVYKLETALFATAVWNFVRMFVLMISRPRLKHGHVRSRTRSQVQIEVISCLHSRGCIFIFSMLKLCLNNCLDVFLVNYRLSSNIVHVGSWTSSLHQSKGKSCYLSRNRSFPSTAWNFVRMFVLTISRPC